jgi:site-specific DNA recombinase
MKRLASCYCRYSSDKQQQQSIDFQLGEIKKFCDKNKITLIKEYVDEAQSGTNDNRIQFQKMIEDSEYSEWNYLLVYNLSRLARSVEDQIYYQKILKKKGILVISVEEKFEDTPEGDLFNLITAGINEYYSKHLAKRSFAGVLQNASKSLAIGGIPPLGYDVDQNKKYIINPKEAEAVKIIYEKTAEGWSYTEISNYLNDNNFRTKRGNRFSNNFHETLTNQKYTGDYVFNLTSKKKGRGPREERKKSPEEVIINHGGMPKIIERELFDKVQTMLKLRKQKRQKGHNLTKYMLSGILECGYCGYAYVGSSTFHSNEKSPRFNYRHSKYKKVGCSNKEIPTRRLDKWIKEDVISEMFLLKNANTYLRSINSQLLTRKAELKGKIEALNEQLKNLSIKIEAKAKDVAEQKLSMFTLEELRALKTSYREITEEIQDHKNIEKQIEKITLESLKDFIQDAKRKWNNIEAKQQRDQFFKDTFVKITITNEIIKCYIPYDRFTDKITGIELVLNEIPRELLMKNGFK